MIACRPRTASAVASLLLLIGLAAPAAAQETQDSTRLPASLNTARASMSAALTKSDNAAAAALFTEDGSVDSQGQAVTGRAAITGWFAEALTGVSALHFGAPTFLIADDRVRERADYMVRTTQGEQRGRVETVWQKQEDGSWKVARLIVS